MQFLNANNASAILAVAISPTDTVIVLQAGQGALFPQPNSGNSYFVATLSRGLLNEIIWVTDRSSDVLTVVRAQEGTPAQNWPAAITSLQQLVTRDQLQGLVQRIPNYKMIDLGAGGGTRTIDLASAFVFQSPAMVVELTAAAPTVIGNIIGVQLNSSVCLIINEASSPISIPLDTPPFFLANISGPMGWPGTPLDSITFLYRSATASFKWLEVGRNWRTS